MKVKHFAGYGSVNVLKIDRVDRNGIVSLHLRVFGNHECGIERRDPYDVVRWIGTRCDKNLTDSRQVININTEDYYVRNNNHLDEEVCDYYITYRMED